MNKTGTPWAFVCIESGAVVLSLEEAVTVANIREEYRYLATHRCPDCGGQWRIYTRTLLEEADGHRFDRLAVVCQRCSRSRAFLFAVDSLFSGSRG